MGLGSKNGAVLSAIVEMLAFVLLLERLFSGEAKKKKHRKRSERRLVSNFFKKNKYFHEQFF